MANPKDKFSAAEQGLGYIYQIRFALLQMMQLPEETACFMEKGDDLEFVDPYEEQSLASLKHKASGDRLTDLSVDFWKSVRIWLARFKNENRDGGRPRFFLFTTSDVADGSFLRYLLPETDKPPDLAQQADMALKRTDSKVLLPIKEAFNQLTSPEKQEFLSSITIVDHQVRIGDVPKSVMDRMRTVRPAFRPNVYERLEGWWVNVSIDLLTGKRAEPARGWEVSEKLSAFADEFRDNNLPIDYCGKEPPEGVHPEEDSRMFVTQLRMLGLKTDRIKRAILDYYRAFEQRGSWAREHVTVSGEVERYDERLVDEWNRYRAVVFEKLGEESPEETLIAAGRDLLNWVETNDSPRLRIRPAVTEAYVMVGSYHILANEPLTSRVHWHPRFMDRLNQILVTGTK